MLEGDSLHMVALWLILAYCAAPGAVNAETVRRGFRDGFGAALLVQLGAVTGRVLWAGLALVGAHVLSDSSVFHVSLTALGSAVLLRMAWFALVSAPSTSPDRAAKRGDFAAGMLLSLSNPLALVFWSGLVSLLRLDCVEVGDVGVGLTVVATLAFGALAWSLGAALTIGWGRRFVRQPFVRATEFLAGLILGGFGLQMGWETLRGLAVMAGW
jgi:chemosensory pili system protein ChpE